jgi:hypothetical protein
MATGVAGWVGPDKVRGGSTTKSGENEKDERKSLEN